MEPASSAALARLGSTSQLRQSAAASTGTARSATARPQSRPVASRSAFCGEYSAGPPTS